MALHPSVTVTRNVTRPVPAGARHRAVAWFVGPVKRPPDALQAYSSPSPSGSDADATNCNSSPGPTLPVPHDTDTVGERFVDGVSSSAIVTSTAFGSPRVTDDGRLPSATVNVSSSRSASWFAAILPAPVIEPAVMVMDGSAP